MLPVVSDISSIASVKPAVYDEYLEQYNIYISMRNYLAMIWRAICSTSEEHILIQCKKD